MTIELAPLTDRDEFRHYIDAHWAQGHILARNPAMTDFTYGTPWVDRAAFPDGYSVIGAYSDDRLVGFIGAITAPYPRPRSYWLALWHVLPELKGTGSGGRLLQAMQDIALDSDGWIGTFGAGPDALPVYLNRGYAVRGVRRWIYSPEDPAPQRRGRLGPSLTPPPTEWAAYRFDHHPVFEYERVGSDVFRTERNEWGRVTHAVWLSEDADRAVEAVYARERAAAREAGEEHLLDAWSYEAPGPKWQAAPRDLPSVFHPPEARGNLIFAVGLPMLPPQVQKGDCDQDRPN
jgi:GNAT superfamily N-acetyltransferase